MIDELVVVLERETVLRNGQAAFERLSKEPGLFSLQDKQGTLRSP
jgi:hypothetical protein